MLGVPWTYRVRLAQNYEQEHTILGRRRRGRSAVQIGSKLAPWLGEQVAPLVS
jgi:hypothetical protein